MKSLKAILSAVGAGALVMAALPAGAVPVVVESDVLQVLDPSGGLFKFTRANEGFPEGSGTMYIVDSNTGNPAAFGHPTAFTEPNSNDWSDMVGVILNPDGSGRYVLAFLSDIEGPLNQAAALLAFGAVAPRAVVVETGGLQDITTPYLNPDPSYAGYTAQFRSDVPDAGTTVALLGMALAGLGIARRKLA